MALVHSAAKDIDMLSGAVLDDIVADDKLRQACKLQGGMQMRMLMISIILGWWYERRSIV